ncbi:hypothetical protein OG203_43310 [Nocardia sp. NBC_01499]|uniref:hypothetical protein n=1 Tax=Nocardia sp. NBC_01499 TaxID=2903597 RepID=UPI003867E85E
MITRRAFLLTVFLFGITPAVILSVVNGFLPTPRDVSDPLGRPSALSNELIDSAGQFDTLTTTLIPKHAQLASGAQAFVPLSSDLQQLTDKAGAFSGLAANLGKSTATVVSVAGPLPGLLNHVAGRVDQASSTVGALSTSVGSVGTQLDSVHHELLTVQVTLAALGPKAATLAATLATIQEEAAHVSEFGPLLAIIGPLVNGLAPPPH